jgi:hypothetical protein
MFPTNDINTVFAINAGDTITASVDYRGSSKDYVIVVTDVTSGNSFTKDEQCASDLICHRSSADVIAEDVGKGGGKFFPLADYGTMKFSAMSVTDKSGNTGSFTDSNWLNAGVTEQSGKETFATVSVLNGAGTSFKATWKSV